LYTKHQNGFNCGKYITDIPGYFNYVNIILKLYFVITKRYCALIALWKPRRISSQTKHECRLCSHEPLPAMQTMFSNYMFSICWAKETVMEPCKDSYS
jgi:hypothetical protein